MTEQEKTQTAMLLPNGKILIVGQLDIFNRTALDSAEVYDPGSEL